MNSFEDFLLGISSQPLPVLDVATINSNYVELDLSESNSKLLDVDVSSSSLLEIFINAHIKKNKAKVAFGGYNETRNIYRRSNYFNLENKTERNIHLGIDLWCEANTKVCAPLDCEIHSFKNNTHFGDYGPTIILKHMINNNNFFTLYGHLTVASIENLKVNQVFKQGEVIGFLGDATVNGDYPPHLHFQIIRDLEHYNGDYQGVCSKNDLEFYLNNCPDPNLLLKL